MTTPQPPDGRQDDPAGAGPEQTDAEIVSLSKDAEQTVSVARPEFTAAQQTSAPEPRPDAVYYSDQQTYPAQGYPAQPGYPGQVGQAAYPAQPGYPAQPAYPTPSQAYPTPSQAYGVPGADAYGAAYNSAYANPGYPAYPARSSTNGLAIASLVVGGAGLLLTFCFFVTGFLSGLVAIVLGGIGLKQVNSEPAPDGGSKGMAIGGIALGVVQLLLAIGWSAFVAIGITRGW